MATRASAREAQAAAEPQPAKSSETSGRTSIAPLVMGTLPAQATARTNRRAGPIAIAVAGARDGETAVGLS